MPHPRAALQAQIPASYRWWAHVAYMLAFCGAGTWVCATQLVNVRPWEWLFFTGALVFSNFGE